jgi:predicted MFS family arabinose efflux permease
MLQEQPTVRALSLTAFGYVTAVGASRLLLTDQAPRLFGGEGASLGYLMAAMALGGVLGAILGGRFGHQHQSRIYIVGNLCEAPCWPLLLVAHHEIPALLIMVLAGIFESAPTVAYYAEVQTRLSPAEVSAYYAGLMPLTQVSSAIGALGGGLLLAAGGAWALSIGMACLIAGPIIALSGSLSKISPGSPKATVVAEGRT